MEYIQVIVEGGVVQDVIIPKSLPDVCVEICDYDIDGVDDVEDEYLDVDDDGNKYRSSMWYASRE